MLFIHEGRLSLILMLYLERNMEMIFNSVGFFGRSVGEESLFLLLSFMYITNSNRN
jgi:hypothetical protein